MKHSQMIRTTSLLFLISTLPIYSAENMADEGFAENMTDEGFLRLIIFFIIMAIVVFALKTLFNKFLIKFGMAEVDRRSKTGLRLTALGKFIASISGLLIFFLFMFISYLSK